jgi:hypothetical protein
MEMAPVNPLSCLLLSSYDCNYRIHYRASYIGTPEFITRSSWGKSCFGGLLRKECSNWRKRQHIETELSNIWKWAGIFQSVEYPYKGWIIGNWFPVRARTYLFVCISTPAVGSEGSFHWVKATGARNWPHRHQIPFSRMRQALPSSSIYPHGVMLRRRNNLTFSFLRQWDLNGIESKYLVTTAYWILVF